MSERTGLHKLGDVIFGITPKPFYIASSNYNPGQNICNKIEKSRKPVQVKKSLISTFACFWTAIAKVQLLEGRLATMSPPKFEIFLFILIS